jgi:hypothetical protein
MTKHDNVAETRSGNTVSKLKELRRKFKTGAADFRALVRNTVAGAMGEVLKLRSNKSELEKFLKEARIKQPAANENHNKSSSWLAKAVMVFVLNPKSENAKKLAWKRARIGEHLLDFHGIPVDRIAEEIRKRGGFEAVASLAAKENPLRRKSESDDVKRGESTTDSASKSRKEGTLLLSINGELSAKLAAVAAGTRVKLIGTRSAGGKPPSLEIERVIALRQKPRLRWGKSPKTDW